MLLNWVTLTASSLPQTESSWLVIVTSTRSRAPNKPPNNMANKSSKQRQVMFRKAARAAGKSKRIPRAEKKLIAKELLAKIARRYNLPAAEPVAEPLPAL